MTDDKKCPHMSSCEMYKLFTLSGTLAVWKTNYCTSEYERCQRYKRSAEGKSVPINLMPNGTLLKRAT
jgi:hypothetical protein